MERTPTPLVAGQLIAGRFRIDRQLGAGAMGAVFSATDTATHETYAIKVIHPHVAQAGVNVERFRREISLAQQVGHPGIVRVFDAGQDPHGGLFLVMEQLQGVTFRLPLTQGELTVLQALEVMTATLDALQAAHRLGIVHRDLKPDNIFLHAPQGRAPEVKLLDFGVARQANGAGITTTNVGVGTPHFMAPEQATDARSVTAASDVWSAGVILYYIVSGALPFDGDGPYDTVLRACTMEHRPLSRAAPDIDYRLLDIIETCLEKDPEERFQDANELLEVLLPLLNDPAVARGLASKTAAEIRYPTDQWSASFDDKWTGSVAMAPSPAAVSAVVPAGPSAPMRSPAAAPSPSPPPTPASGPSSPVPPPAEPRRSGRPPLLIALAAAIVFALVVRALVLDARPPAAPPESLPFPVVYEAPPPKVVLARVPREDRLDEPLAPRPARTPSASRGDRSALAGKETSGSASAKRASASPRPSPAPTAAGPMSMPTGADAPVDSERSGSAASASRSERTAAGGADASPAPRDSPAGDDSKTSGPPPPADVASSVDSVVPTRTASVVAAEPTPTKPTKSPSSSKDEASKPAVVEPDFVTF